MFPCFSQHQIALIRTQTISRCTKCFWFGVYLGWDLKFVFPTSSPGWGSRLWKPLSFFKYKFIYFNWRLITLQYFIGFAIHQQESATCSQSWPLFHLPPHTIPLGHPSALAPSILYPASNLDWRFISYVTLYMFQCHSPKSTHLLPLPQSPKDCSIHLCLFCFKRGGESFGRMALKHV